MRRISGWLPTPIPIVLEALDLAAVSYGDLVVDCGCGDGRVVVEAAKSFGAQAIGVDVDRRLVVRARQRIRQHRVPHLASIERASMLRTPAMRDATVIFLYLPQPAVNRMAPIIRHKCRRGTRVVSVDSWLYRWPAEKTLSIRFRGEWWTIGLWRV